MNVLKIMGVDFTQWHWVDTAVIARAVGADSKLEAAGPQLLGLPKLETGEALMQKFSFPLEEGGYLIDSFADWDNDTQQDWREYISYCRQDARIAFEIAEDYGHFLASKEERAFNVTHQMNQRGWYVDLDAVQRMQKAYKLNLDRLEREFHIRYPNPDGSELNFRSTPQLRKWCKERGVNLTSFDELSVQKALTRIQNRLSRGAMPGAQSSKLHEVHDLLETKQMLGGSSLSKLQKILDLVGEDGRLRDQYLHIGAGQTYRTSGRGVQMQNLKRLSSSPLDMEDTMDVWTNEELSQNLRQAFTAEHPDGMLIVGDFAAVESRGLAYLAGAEWKLDSYRQGKDMYKVLYTQMKGVPYEHVSSDQRRFGKVGELSCGYQAGPPAVMEFSERMGNPLTLAEATDVVQDWRSVNPEIVEFWDELNEMLLAVVQRGQPSAQHNFGAVTIEVRKIVTPASVLKVVPGAQTIQVVITNNRTQAEYVARTFQGCYMHGRDICYLKPSERKSGPLWRTEWTKAGQRGRYKLYGGKLAGILTQSFCRELFFDAAILLEENFSKATTNAQLIGQFHDELVVEWSPEPESTPLKTVIGMMDYAMSSSRKFPDFPLAVEIKYAHRYIK